jgi:hypothetical protein
VAEKLMTIIFNGISTLFPPPPRNSDENPKNAFVLMAASKQNRPGAPIPEHFPFVFVPISALNEPVPPPDKTTTDESLGNCNIYFLNNCRVTLDPPPSTPITYHMDNSLALAERPGSDDVARPDDIRWLADFRDIVPSHSQLKKTANPTATPVGDEVAAVIELAGGTLKASFPCKSVQPKTFKDSKGSPLPGLKRVLASEFLIDMAYPERASTVTLNVSPLRPNSPSSGMEALTLKWPETGQLVIRMGNDTLREALLAGSLKRCDGRGEKDEPLLIPEDSDFDLHYDLLDLPLGSDRPLPQAGPHQSSGDGCKPGT